ncbi:MarR family winged helix-turn-helix transcriptional regulator [Pseudorhodoferax sp.]|uniref:MarR family winged helix-turn-helix transcriptional regulator n=1 Tax=Pseudorhodoferax sp. TaxID=1993553 RepID=UPI002DD6207E|nr:MarR family transcriptional regulator [Pseudorhodoferax sp.]
MASRPRLFHLLNRAQRRLQLWAAAEQARATPVDGAAPSPAQGGVLFVLLKSDGATMGELAKALDLVPSAVSGLVQRMEALGWVQRHPCTGDARTLRVWLRPAGHAQLPALRQALSRINAQLTDGFSEAELQTVARWLEHVQRLRVVDPE